MLIRQSPCNLDSPVVSVFNISPLSTFDGPGKRVVVFFQGCNQRCSWCHSPHSQLDCSPLLYREQNCTLCMRCQSACPHQVHRFIDGKHIVDRSHCTQCGDCVAACPNSSIYDDSGVLSLPTRKTTARALFQQLQPYLSLADGVTLSGGEALLQDGTLSFLQLCKENNIHVCVETSGLLDSSRYKAAAPFVDGWLFGVRVVTNECLHFNTKRLLSNVKILQSCSNCDLLPIIPLIPNVINRAEVLQEILLVILAMDIDEIRLNPWNRFCEVYYRTAGIPFTFTMPTNSEIEQCENKVISFFTEKGYNILF